MFNSFAGKEELSKGRCKGGGRTGWAVLSPLPWPTLHSSLGGFADLQAREVLSDTEAMLTSHASENSNCLHREDLGTKTLWSAVVKSPEWAILQFHSQIYETWYWKFYMKKAMLS